MNAFPLLYPIIPWGERKGGDSFRNIYLLIQYIIYMSTCKKCKANITWKETGRGYRPLNNDGSPHFKTCLYPDQRVVKSGKFRSSDPIQIGKDEYI